RPFTPPPAPVSRDENTLAKCQNMAYVRPQRTGSGEHLERAPDLNSNKGPPVKVIASSIRKGNIIEKEDGQLYVVLTAESFFPGKGTPTTKIDMRRLSDGEKTTDRYKTTEQVERAYVEDMNFSSLYEDANAHTFMNAETYDQIVVPADVI